MRKKISILISIATALASLLVSLILWFIFQIFFFFIVFFLPLIFPLLGPKKEEAALKCPNCATPLEGNENFCPSCGNDLRKGDTRRSG